MYNKVVKKIFDLIFALSFLILLSPILILTSILLSFEHKGNPFFIQLRPGYRENLFSIIKFKTMNDDTNDEGELLKDEFRLTSMGKFIRNSSLDEIPQLINVLKGDMSLVGPRPLLPEYLSLYKKNQKKRHDVKPGITGLAQVSGRNAISWREKFQLDMNYVNRQSFLLDLKIIIKTIAKVLQSKGINDINENSIEPFNGEN